MIKIENHLGLIEISYDYLTALIGQTVTSCFGVAGMNSSGAKQNFLSILKRDNTIDKGVLIKLVKNKLLINLHITVTYGTNISAIVKSISNKVRYTVEEETGIQVLKVNVYIDGMKS